MSKMKILKRDFDAAVAVPWATDTCLVAQALIRLGLPNEKGDATDFATHHGLERLQNSFDAAHIVNGSEKLAEIRASLPITIQ